MKRKEETQIMLHALSLAGIEPTADVESAVRCGLKLIRAKKFREKPKHAALNLDSEAIFQSALGK